MTYSRPSFFAPSVAYALAVTLFLLSPSASAQEQEKPAESPEATSQEKPTAEAQKPPKPAKKDRNKKEDKSTQDRLELIEKKLDTLVDKLGNLTPATIDPTTPPKSEAADATETPEKNP